MPSLSGNPIAVCLAIALAHPILLPPPALAQPALTEQAPVPTWETQRKARVYQLRVPAPRGIISDRNGGPLASSRVGWDICHPAGAGGSTPPAHAAPPAAEAWLIPHPVEEDVSPGSLRATLGPPPGSWYMSPRYYREYPGGRLAGHVLGYVGRRAPLRVGPVENGDFLFSEEEGKEGLEAMFDVVLCGEPGTMTVNVDQSGKVVHRKISRPPVPGKNVVTALDMGVQKILEEILSSTGHAAVGVIVDPSTGDILAAASTPNYEPASMSPARSFLAAPILSDPSAPLLPRAFRGTYPPASAFKPFVALAAMGSGAVGPEEKIGCPSSLKVGNMVFRNWSSSDAGPMDVAEALSTSCNTWFYRAALKTGAAPMVRVAAEFGFGRPPVVLFPHPASGLVPDDRYMMSRHGRRILPGDAANISIGQGDVLVTPLQMAMAYAALGNGGVLHRPRLVLQVQEIDNGVVSGYAPRPRRLSVSPPLLDAVVRGLEGAVKHGTARSASVSGLKVAGKTGTAQWGPESERKRLAWFCGFAPSRDPELAFAFLIEGRPGQSLAGSDAASLAGKVLRRLKSEGFISERKPSPSPGARSPADGEEDTGSSESSPPGPVEVYEQPSVDLTPFLEPGQPTP